jgi:hypothetical protein
VAVADRRDGCAATAIEIPTPVAVIEIDTLAAMYRRIMV